MFIKFYSPFTGSHQIVVQFFVQIVEKALCLHNHRINFVWREFQLVAWQRMGQTKSHGGHLFLWQTGQQTIALRPNASQKLLYFAAGHALQVQFLFDRIAQLGIGHHQLGLNIFRNQFLQCLFQRFRNFALDCCCGSGQCFCGIFEFLEMLQFHTANKKIKK